jgi:hypothetical protein
MIEIIRRNFQEAQVDELVLDSMIGARKIIAFRRSDEWVVVGRDPVREQHKFHQGEERRKTIHGEDFCMK